MQSWQFDMKEMHLQHFTNFTFTIYNQCEQAWNPKRSQDKSQYNKNTVPLERAEDAAREWGKEVERNSCTLLFCVPWNAVV